MPLWDILIQTTTVHVWSDAKAPDRTKELLCLLSSISPLVLKRHLGLS